MPQATVTVIENALPTSERGPHKITVDTGTKQMKMKAWPEIGASLHKGDTYEIGWTDEQKSWEGKSYTEHTIKGATPKLQAPKSDGAATPRPGDVGPHLAMWEKEAFAGLRAGLTRSEVTIMGIDARLAARDILRTDLDGKLPVTSTPEQELNDSLEF